MAGTFYNRWCESGDQLGKSLMSTVILYKLPNFVKRLIQGIFRFLNRNRHAAILDAFTVSNIDGIKDLAYNRYKHLDQIQEMWSKLDLDALIIPTYPIPAFPARLADSIGLMPCGAGLAIYWQFCTGFLPVTCVKEDEQHFEEKVHNDPLTRAANTAMQGSKGMPVGVEVCCLPFRDEKALRIMQMIEKEVNFHSEHPYPDLK